MDIRRGTATVLFAALLAGGASADHPGALWSIERLDVRADGATAAQVSAARLSLMQANETYFYGDQAVRMVARVSGDGSVRVDVLDARSGATLIRAARLDDLGRTALAWMDGLDCTAGHCGNAAQTQLAAVAEDGAAPAAVAKAMTPAKPTTQVEAKPVAWPKKVNGVIAEAAPQTRTAAAPMPRPRPGTELSTAPDLAALRRVSLARNPVPVPDASVPPIRISRFDTRGLGPISYGADDELILGEPRTLAPANRAVSQPQATPSRSLIGRWVDKVATLLGIADAPAPKPKAIAAVRAPQPTASSIVPQGTALKPTSRWATNDDARQEPLRLAALDPASSGAALRLTPPQTEAPTTQGAAAAGANRAPTDGPRLVVRAPGTATGSSLPLPAAAQGIRVLPSPGLGLPRPQGQPTDAVQVTPIRLTPARPTRRSDTKLAVKLHPEVLGRYSTSVAERLFGSYGRPNAPLRLVSEDGGGGRSVDSILARRDLALDSDRYAKAERIFWSGRSGSRGFWISLPQVLRSDFVLVASDKASVIANVYPRGASVQVSDAVAKALGLSPGQWSDVQIIALKKLERTAGRRTGTVAR